tara:strand:+ start:20066 stop:20758 length:693 start_codon:yes stop_codon:yes gene_type:complete
MEMETKQQQLRAQIPESWMQYLAPEFEKDYMQNLRAFLKTEYEKRKSIYPPSKEVFAALQATDFKKVRVVILGQDPYHGPEQAHGLAFSVRDGVRPPPSLKNIFKELQRDLGKEIPASGDLSSWARQGVLLLNATLTVEAAKAGSHQKKGWEDFTDKIIHYLNQEREHLVFMLWGAYAQKKGAYIDTKKHLVLKSVHPSPLSAHRGFLGCGHFSKANAYLKQHGHAEIRW